MTISSDTGSSTYDCSKCWIFLKEMILELLFSQTGILSVYIMNFYGNVNSIMACSSLSLIVALVFPQFSMIFLTAAFGGIMSTSNFPSFGYYFLSGFIIFILFQLLKPYFLDIGGKAGSTAFISNMITIVCVYIYNLMAGIDYNIVKVVYDSGQYELLTPWVYAFAPIFGAVASVMVYFVGEYRSDIESQSSRVFTYGVVALFGSNYLQTFSVDYYRMVKEEKEVFVSYGSLFLTFWHAGSIAGMTMKKKFENGEENKISFYHYIITGYISGWVLISLCGVSLVGGKHGLSAFISNNLYLIFLKIVVLCKQKSKKPRANAKTIE